MMRIPFSYIWRSLWARRLTTALTVGGVALGVFVFAGVLMLARGLEAALVETGSPDNVIVLRRSATSELSSQVDRATADVLEAESGVARGAEGRALLSREVVLVIDLFKKKSNALGNVSIRGVSPRALELRSGVHIVQGRPFQFGTHEVVVGKGIAKLFKGVALEAELAFGGDRWTVVGIADAGGTAFDSEIWGDVDQFMQAFGRPVYSSVTFRLAQRGGFDQLKIRLQADPRMQYVELKHERDYYQEQSKTLATFIRTLGIVVTTIFSFGAMIGAMITMYAALAARGWDTQPAWFAATGMQALVVLLEEITEAEREALVRWGAKAGADVLTGEGWALVGAPASRLAPLARPDRLPPGLERLAPELGRFLAGYADPPRRWALGVGSALDLDHPVLIGIVNVTPDSFSDGGRFATVDRAVAQAERLVADGCELLDVGGESTRPGSAPVPVDEEIGRVAPVIEQLVRRGLGPISVDTRKAAVARAALAAGAAVVNDVSGLAFDAALAGVVGAAGAGMIVMHMRGTPDTMDSLAVYRHVAADVAAELGAAAARAEAGGVARERIVVDPGFGFAKTPEQNFRLLDELATVVGLGYPVAVGPSRKRFLGHATGRPVDDRDRATAVACALAWERGARLFRVHDAALTSEALRVASATTSCP